MIWNYAASEFKGWAKEWNSYYIQLSEFFIASIPYSWSVYDNKGKVWKQYIQKYRIRKKKIKYQSVVKDASPVLILQQWHT